MIAIINSSSGSPADNNANRLRDVLQARELSWGIWPARDGLELCSLAQKAAAGDARIVVAGHARVSSAHVEASSDGSWAGIIDPKYRLIPNP